MADTSQSPMRFKIFRGENLLEERELTLSSIKIGSAEGADLRLDDPNVGPLHAVINVEDDGTIRLVDLGTETGTVHQGQRIANVELSNGDAFEFGTIRIELAFEDEEPTHPTASSAAISADGDELPVLEIHALDEIDPGESRDNVMDIIARAGRGNSNLGLDTKAPKVLEVSQIWQNMMLDSLHYKKGHKAVSVGSSTGFKWSLLGVELGWIPNSMAGVMQMSPPIWSDVNSAWRSDFYAPDSSLPGGFDFELFKWDGSQFVARVDSHWAVTAEINGQDYNLDQLVAMGKASKNGQITEIAITDDIRLMINIDGLIFFSHMVHPSKKVAGGLITDVDYTLLATFSVMAFIGGVFGAYVATSPPPAQNDISELEDQFAQLLLEKPEKEEKKKEDKPDKNPDAGEGKKAKKKEGKVGKKDAKQKQAKGNKREADKSQQDKEIAENAGLLGAFDDAGMADLGDAGLSAGMAGGLGGLIGAKGTQAGVGGLGSRGSGMGGGGSASGLGGYGTKGMGSGSSGYGKGGGSFGDKGGGGMSARGGSPVIMGSLDRALIDKVVKRRMQSIRYCYQRELQKNPTLAGKVKINFTIAGDGSVAKASVLESIGSSAVDSCVRQQFMKMTFPEPKGGGIVIVKYPFIFSPG